MRKFISFLLILLCVCTPVFSQSQNSWINGNQVYKWPSFMKLASEYMPSDLSGYTIQAHEEKSGIILTNDNIMFQKEALSVAYQLVGGYNIKKYGVSKEKLNIIPYQGGIIVYLYSEERNRWELFNLIGNVLSMEYSYRRFDIVKKR